MFLVQSLDAGDQSRDPANKPTFHCNLPALTRTRTWLGSNLFSVGRKISEPRNSGIFEMLLSTLQIRASYPAQLANRLGREHQDLSKIAYLVTGDEQLRANVGCIIEANGIRVKWFRSAPEYLGYERPEVASCLLISRGRSDLLAPDLQRMLAGSRTPPIIVLSGDGDIPSCVRAIKEGAHDFLTLPLMTPHLLDAMNAAFQKDRATLIMRLEREDLRNRWRSLTSREAEVMRYVVGGFLNKQTAAELRITENTVQVHRGRVMRKMQADSFAALVRMALKLEDWGENSLLHGRPDIESATSIHIHGMM